MKPAACQCRQYLEGLLGYLEGFYDRTQPLQAQQKLYKPLEDFQQEFDQGRVSGWEDRGEGRSASEAEGQIDLEAFDSVDELLTLGQSHLSADCSQIIPMN